MLDLAPEQRARQQIDAQLVASGWVVQDYKQFNPGAGLGIALREVPLKSGTCDYLLLVDRKAVGVIEAKKQGTLLSGVAEQSDHYAANLPDFFQRLTTGSLPFLYESTGIETVFRDDRDPEARSRRVFSFHRPETVVAWLAEPDTLRARLATLPMDHPLPAQNLRACQLEGMRGMLGYYRAVLEDIEQNKEHMGRKLDVPILALGGDVGSAPDLYELVKPLGHNVRGGLIAQSSHYILEEQPETLPREITSFIESLPSRSN